MTRGSTGSGLLATLRLAARRGVLREERGSALTEMAIMSPLLVVICLWLIYFWEMQQAKIKAAEAARYLTFERVMQRDPGTIEAEVKDRYQDLDGSTRGRQQSATYWNRLTITRAQVSTVGAPLIESTRPQQPSGVGSLLSQGLGMLGGGLKPFLRRFDLDPNRGGVRGDVEFRMENRIVPERIGEYLASPDGTRSGLDLVFRDGMEVYADTWRAWHPGNPIAPKSAAIATAHANQYQTTRKITFMGFNSSGLNSLAQSGLKMLLIDDWPLADDYIRDTTRMDPMVKPGILANPTTTAGWRFTVRSPGDWYYGTYWKTETRPCGPMNPWCEPLQVMATRQLLNRHYRSRNCRGPFFQGTTKPGLYTEYEYAYEDVDRANGNLKRNLEGQLFTFNVLGCEHGAPLGAFSGLGIP